MTDRKKLIEVALPLDAINDASAYDKLPGIGPHPKGIHKWWAPLPLPCARAVVFASLVDDPSSDPRHRDRPRAEQDEEREKLFQVMRQLLDKDAINGAEFMAHVRELLSQSCDGDVPSLFDPFCGSGAIPLEGRRLGLSSLASDLNPIAVLMTKALIEIPSRFSGSRPVHPLEGVTLPVGGYESSSGLAEDLRYYGRVVWKSAVRQLSSLYPKVSVPRTDGGDEARVMAWIWARTVRCPNPACGTDMPLVSSMMLAKKSKRGVWLDPRVDSSTRKISFEIAEGDPRNAPTPPKIGRGAKFRCLACENVAPDQYIKDEGKAGRLGRQLVAVVAEGTRKRIYLSASAVNEDEVDARPAWAPDLPLAEDPRNIWCVNYGIEVHRDLYTSRQLTALSTLTELVAEMRSTIERDARAASFAADDVAFSAGGSGAKAYADAILTYLALSVDRCVDFNNTGCRWVPSNEKVMNLFSRQAIPIVWDYAEANPIGESVGSWKTCVDYVADCLDVVVRIGGSSGHVRQADAARLELGPERLLVSTDPPYYDNIAYSDLSDLFYVWLRRTLQDVYPDLLTTLATPKGPELVAAPNRFGGSRAAARAHFEEGFLAAFGRLRNHLDDRFPMTVYYAFKQSEESGNGNRGANADSTVTGWETMLSALLGAGFQVTATWPVRASQKWRMISMGTNALASYIVLACRPRSAKAPQASRAEFLSTLRDELPDALRRLQLGSVAPVDLAQAAIGPGMAVFSRFSRVVEASGNSMDVRAALTLINQVLDEVLSEQESEFDSATRWAIAWYEQYGLKDGPFGAAETLAVAKAVAIGGLQESGMLVARAGKVRLLGGDELADDWDPREDRRITDWEATHHLVKRLMIAGESGASHLMRLLAERAEPVRDLAYRLFAIAERKGWSTDAQGYNSLVVSWEEVQRLAGQRRVEALF